jgi:hypothetical protein
LVENCKHARPLAFATPGQATSKALSIRFLMIDPLRSYFV